MEKQREKVPPSRNPGEPEHTPWKREVADSQPWPVRALGNNGPVCPGFSREAGHFESTLPKMIWKQFIYTVYKIGLQTASCPQLELLS